MNHRTLVCLLMLAAVIPLRATRVPNRDDSWFYVDTLPREDVANRLVTLRADPRLKLTMGSDTVVLSGDGRQPFLFCSGKGTLFCQAQITAPPFRTKDKQVYMVRIGSAISRDGGRTWAHWTHQENHDDVNIEGGMVQCADGTILLLDTFVMKGSKPDHGVGELWKSHDDLRTVEGPYAVDFYLPHIQWAGSTNDVGKSEASARVHRSLLELPNGDLLTTLYSRFEGDTAPSGYMPTMLKSRTVVIRSRDHGATWAYLATVGVDSGVGTEGFGEPVMARLDRGPHAGRLVCVMRTGRDLYQSQSEDNGAHWRHPWKVQLPGVDIYDIAQWEGLFGVDSKAPDYVPKDEMNGSLVDPELIQMSNGVLVCAFGFRAPEKTYKFNWHARQNGDYLAFSLDSGKTWSHVVEFRSGAPTTQYTGVREIRPGVLYVVYDDCIWKMPGNAKGFELAVEKTGAKNL
jgi:hypothetical protein